MYITVPPADAIVGVFSILCPEMSKLVVARLCYDILLSEIHNMPTLAVSRLRKTFRSSICEESEDILRQGMQRSCMC